MADGAVSIGAGAFFLFVAGRTALQGSWMLENDRQGYLNNPTRLRRVLYRISVCVDRIIVPAILTALGLFSIARGMAAIV